MEDAVRSGAGVLGGESHKIAYVKETIDGIGLKLEFLER